MRRFLLIVSVFLSASMLVMLGVHSSHAQTSVTLTPIPPKLTLQAGKTFVVTNLNSDGLGSLLQAIGDAGPSGTVTFDPSLSGLIDLPQQVPINENLTLIGPISRAVTIHATFSIFGDVTVSFRDLVFRGAGQAIRVNHSILNITHCIFQDLNPAIGNADGTVTVTDSTFTFELSGDGIGIETGGGSLLVTGSTFVSGSGIVSGPDGTITVVNSTFYRTSYAIGTAATTTVINSTIYTRGTAIDTGVNTTPHVTVQNTILAFALSNAPKLPICNGVIKDGGGNLQFPDTGCGNGIRVGDPKLGPLADNGGPTQTIALLPGSAAIGKGDPAVCNSTLVKNTDQRGLTRISGVQAIAICDSGAYQHEDLIPTATSNINGTK